MLLGIALHAGLSFTPFPWAVQDERQSNFFWFLFAAIHGFRMPVFFVLSGFFTAMLWRGRGLKPVLSHRFRRVLLPFLLGLVTIVPSVNWISGWAIASRLEANAAKAEKDNIWSAAKNGNLAAIERHVQGGADIDGIDPAFGQTPLVWAALVGQLEAVDWLLQNGAAVNGRTKDGGTPLHAVAFLGRVEIAKLLLQHGADIEAKNDNGDTPRAALEVDWELTQYLAGLLQIELDARQVEDGRVEIAGLFGQFPTGNGREKTDKPKEESAAFLKAMASPIFFRAAFSPPLVFVVPLLVGPCLRTLRPSRRLAAMARPTQVAGSFADSLSLFNPSDHDPTVAHGAGRAQFWPGHLLGPSAHAAHITLLRPLFLFWRSVFRLRRPRRPGRKMVVAGASRGAVYRFPARARIFNGCIRISPRDIRSGHGPGRGGDVAGDLRLDDDLWVYRLVPQTLHP